jgi:hypothetical protein
VTHVADEIDNANVIRLTRDDAGLWTAAIGPDDGRGRTALGPKPIDALVNLALALQWCGWVFDPTWRPVVASGE